MNPKNLKLAPRHKWFQSNSDESESWDGPYESMEKAVSAAVAEQTEFGDLGVVWIAQGRPSTKAERDEFGVDWKWWIEGGNATPIQLTNKSTDHKTVQWDYSTWVDQLRDVNHLTDDQLSRLGVIIAHRLRYRSTNALSEMLEGAGKELANQLSNNADLPTPA